MEEIRVIIVDDEVHARRKMHALLGDVADVSIVGECDNGADAVEMIRDAGADVVFLDVQMPGMNGLDVVREVGADEMPMVVFATAYDRFALDAFEAHAIDYLLKPIDPDRLRRTLDYVRRRRREGRRAELSQRLDGLIEHLGGGRDAARKLAVKSGGTVHVLNVGDIAWIEADGNYVTYHASGKTYLHRETLRGVERRLDPRRFIRIHRSYVVNIDYVEKLTGDRHGDYSVVMRDGAKLTLTRTYRDAVLARIEADA